MTPEQVEAARTERRKQAEQAWMDAAIDPDPERNCVTATIEVAARVRITPEIVGAFLGHAHPAPLWPNVIPALKAAFEAAGFEVEQ